MIHKFFVDCVKLFHSRRISERNYFYKHISTSAYNNFKVAIMGGAGSIGQYLGLMLLRDCFVSRLALYDVSKTTPGVAEDLSHINSGVCVEGGFVGENQIHMALCGANVVVITAGKRRKAGMTQDDLFKSNAKLIVDTCLAINQCCPLALIAIVTNPVNSLVPVAVELLTSFQKTYCQKIFGVTTLDLVRASTFTAQQYGLKPECVFVPVIGGHSGSTIIPLLSQCKPPVNVFAEEQRLCVTEMTQEAGKHVVKAKAKTGSATLSTAVATARFVNSLLKGLAGEPNVIEYTYVKSVGVNPLPYFSSPVLLSNAGCKIVYNAGMLDNYEYSLIKKALPELEKDITRGLCYVKKVNFKVAVLGAAGGVGRPLAMLLKQNAMVTDLALYDKLKSISKVAMDVSHINTSSPVMGLCRKAELCQVLDCASIVVITIAESPQKTLEKTFKKNADIIFELLKAVVVYSPSAFIVIVTDPVNAITPFVSKYMKKACVYDRRRIFGMTTLDVVRASTIVGQMNCVNPLFQYVPVVGGNKKATIVPLLSQSVPPFCNSNIEGTTALIRAAAANVIKKKCGKGSATLSVAYATNRFVNSLLMGLCGEPTKEFAFVRTDDKDNPFFASPIILGKGGIEKILPIGNVTEYEEQLIKVAKLFLKGTKRLADQYIKQRERSIPLVVK